MSSLNFTDLSVVDSLVDFVRGRGYVLDFSDRTFSHFFAAELGVDIDDPRFADQGGSKGKRLRRFLQLADDATASTALRVIWLHRAHLVAQLGRADPVAGAEAKYRYLLAKLSGAPRPTPPPPPPPSEAVRDRLKTEITSLNGLAPHQRGYAFEKFLNGLFELHGMRPREPFRNRGEQIDGSFLLRGDTYLLEAKWQARPIGVAELHGFEGKLGEKAAWARGLFVSYVGFSDDGLFAFGRGKRTLCMDGFDLYEMLERRLSVEQVLDAKSRRAAETGSMFVRVRDLF